MSRRIEGEIIIKRTVEEVFDFCADESNEPRYNPRMTPRRADLVRGDRPGLAVPGRDEDDGTKGVHDH